MSKPKQWKQGRELKHADAWQPTSTVGLYVFDGPFDSPAEMLADLHAEPLTPLEEALNDMADLDGTWGAYPQEAEPDGRLWVGSGDSQ
jgi:hypothetical protein